MVRCFFAFAGTFTVLRFFVKGFMSEAETLGQGIGIGVIIALGIVCVYLLIEQEKTNPF